ncbi:DUF6282 family protein [Neomoorella mulderi]|uniref:Amidohydrolase n=1 Tax=Moorella mulderi DSM 14980 TaxID=1122241 RepID=A0A151ASQ8_9FIRM|nr:DUF6282 family protein [Moorella mulderi]KYH30679.1 amidohydrolase [Moorella mulderi DSM 14980]
MSNKEAVELLKGAIDIHVHSSPDVFPRAFDDLEVAHKCKSYGMKAIVLKSHVTGTADRAQIASKAAEFPVFGGIVLNHEVGSINLAAVNAALRMGAKIVWMPTLNSVEHMRHVSSIPRLVQYFPEGTRGISILNDQGELLEQVGDILACILKYDAVLATGHISPLEAKTLVRVAREYGLKKMIITHPIGGHSQFSLNDLKELVAMGAYIEHCWVYTTPHVKIPIQPTVFAEAVKTLGPEHTILSSDSGQAINPFPTDMLTDFIDNLLRLGISEREIKMMLSDNPQKLLNI